MTKMQKRYQRFTNLVNAYGLSRDDRSSAGEDLDEIMLDYEHNGHIGPYVAVTASGDFIYLKTYSKLRFAQSAAAEYLTDDIYAESPVEIVNLDTGKAWKPVVSWRVVA